MQNPKQKPSTLDIAESFHIAHAMWSLKEVGALDEMTEFVDIESLAVEFKFNKRTFTQVLEYLYKSTNYFELEDKQIKLSENFDDFTEFVFQQYIGAFGPNVMDLPSVLKSPETSGDLVNREAHAAAFNQVQSSSISLLASLIQQLELNHVLDLGCGPGTLLIELANSDDGFYGHGLDVSPSMCREALQNADEQGVSERIGFYTGSAFEFDKAISADVIDSIETIVASSLLNECFMNGNEDVVDYLKYLKQHFPTQPLLVSDYYGCVGHPQGKWTQKGALHDWVQIISGQGVPPPDLETWEGIYKRAGCNLIHAIQDKHSSGFIHVVRL